MRVHVLGSEEHFIDHLSGVHQALSPDLRGEFWTVPDLVPYAATLVPEASSMPRWIKVGRGDYIVICSERDRKIVVGHQIIRFEHGCGLSYPGHYPLAPGTPHRAILSVGTHPAYPGGKAHQGVKAFLNPNHYSADRWRAAYPGAVVEIVGTPKLDEMHNAPAKPRSDPPVVCVTFHCDINVAPETQSAFPYYREAVTELAKRKDIEVIGHSHPKARAERKAFFEADRKSVV